MDDSSMPWRDYLIRQTTNIINMHFIKQLIMFLFTYKSVVFLYKTNDCNISASLIKQSFELVVLHIGYIENPPDTTFKCYELYNDTHCEFHDIYFDGKSFYAKNNRYEEIPSVMMNTMNFSHYWKPKKFEESKVKRVSNLTRDILSFIISIPYPNNMGHNILDGIYPTFAKLLLLNLSSDAPYDIYINQRQFEFVKNKFSHNYKSVFSTFSKGKLHDLDPIIEKIYTFDYLIRVKHLYAGTGRMGQRYINKEFRMLGSKELSSIEKFRDRFYDTYGVNKSVKRDLILIPDNHRFADKGMFHKLVHYLKKKYHNYSAEFVFFGSYSLKDQLKLIARTILYVSGPGTSLINHIFLNDYSFLYNLGDVKKDRLDRYMDEYLVESTPLIQAFYYYESANSITYNLNLLKREICYIMDHHVIPHNFTRNTTEHGSGLSFIGKKYIQYCGMFPDFCDSYIRHIYTYRNCTNVCVGQCTWAESILKNKCNSSYAWCGYQQKFPFKCDEDLNCHVVP